ncbi:hypothetical protein ACFVY4_26705 [Streptomyces sp. NPDC058299]|uniref:hypothetical protein n=1 Tax=Streptomyces sp. NPDC058299 TaxID=3346435 RepID=UPI0036E22A5A
MAQIRVMGDDADEVTRVLEALLPLVNACTALVAGQPVELSKRGPGLRVVFELLPAGPGPVTVEQAGPATRTGARTPRRRALPG